MSIHAFVVAYFGFGSLLLPEIIWGGLSGLKVGEGGVWALRAAGFLATGNALLSWLLRDIRDSGARSAFSTALMLEWVVYLILAVQGQLAGLFNALNWSNVAIAIAWTLLFAYLRYSRQPRRAPA